MCPCAQGANNGRAPKTPKPAAGHSGLWACWHMSSDANGVGISSSCAVGRGKQQEVRAELIHRGSDWNLGQEINRSLCLAYIKFSTNGSY